MSGKSSRDNMSDLNLIQGDCLTELKHLSDESVQCCITSPPYFGLRDYGTAEWEGGNAECDHKGAQLASSSSSLAGYTSEKVKIRTFSMPQGQVCSKCGAIRKDLQIGLEETPDAYVQKMVEIFREVNRILRPDGTLWLNLGDSYSGSWGNYGGQNRGNGSQRPINTGSEIPNPAYDGLEHYRPATSRVEGLKPKDLIGIPWRVAFALQADGWYLRQDVIWHKPNPMPESVQDRCTKAHEYVFLMAKSQRYFYDIEAIREPANYGPKGSEFHTGKTGEHQLGRAQKIRPSAPKESFNGRTETMAESGQNAFRAITQMRNKRSVWTVSTKPVKDAHFATFPPDLIKPMVLAGSAPGDTILDPFNGAGTTGLVALENQRKYIGIELNPDYLEITRRRLSNIQRTMLV